MKNAVVYIHGKGGSADEVLYYKKFFNDAYDVLGLIINRSYLGRQVKNFKTILIPLFQIIMKSY